MKRWLTGDTHFYHRNIIDYTNRPFPDVETMNRTLVENWNARVQPDDEVYVLGDFAFGKDREYELEVLFAELKGKKILLRGNHDGKTVLQLPWHLIAERLNVEDAFLAHEPDAWQHELVSSSPVFCSHVHEIWKMRGRVLNVGTDVWHFFPVSYDKAMEYWKYRFEYYSRHGKDA